MTGGGEEPGESDVSPPDEFDVLSMLTRLEADDPATRREAVATVRAAVDETPTLCAPTIPKLRSLLDAEDGGDREREDEPNRERTQAGERDRTEDREERSRDAEPIDDHVHYQDEIVYCLAKLATELPSDVAPSTPEIAAFAASSHPSGAATLAFRCLDSIADECPGQVVERVEPLIEALEDDLDPWGLSLLARLSRADPAALTSATPVFLEALERAPDRYAPAACDALARVIAAGSTGSLESEPGFDAGSDSDADAASDPDPEPDPELVPEVIGVLVTVVRDADCDPRTRAAASDCLDELVRFRASVESDCPVVAAVLDDGSATSRWA